MLADFFFDYFDAVAVDLKAPLARL
ncbi:hypothetical protein PSP6_270173 [Paraburkholderia tropica]|nr:hypothetical protein PSP6_270173 [Paraburkholderia tropica]